MVGQRADGDQVAIAARETSNVRPLFPPGGPVAATHCGALRHMYGRGGNCWVCGFLRQDTDHCHLYETCDRCHDPVNPCGTQEQLADAAQRSPYDY